MFEESDTPLEREVKRFHDIGKLKDNFQIYIRDTSQEIKDKNHSLLSAFLFLLNSDFENKEALFGFLAIASHHSNVENFFALGEDNRYVGKYCCASKELGFLDEVIEHSKQIDIYKNMTGDRDTLEVLSKKYQRYLRSFKFKNHFEYHDFTSFKKLFASLIYCDKYEAIFGATKETKKSIPNEILTTYIDKLPYHQKRDEFRKFVLNHFDTTHKLFTLTAPTGYGKTLTALEFALKFQKEKIIFALPFTSIIDQVYDVVLDIFGSSEIDIFKIHHKTTIDESIPKDRYSKVKFLMSSFSGAINITTLYQLIFALFGNKNRDNVKFNQFKNAVVVIDEAQSIPYALRQDFIKLCELISEQMNTVFILMSATMPIVTERFKEISNLDYFKEQNRYILKWLDLPKGQDSLIQKVQEEALEKHTLLVVNTVKKAQELYLKFKDKYECFCLNGYMTDYDKQRVIAMVSRRLSQNSEKILLISTQSIEAGVDLDFEVGFREVAPISSIIQTAGRVNRHFGKHQSTLYIFDDICGYSDLIYGDTQMISRALFDILKNDDVEESDIQEISQHYFGKIKQQLESLLVANEIEKLAFEDINKKVEEIIDNGVYKELIIVEPCDGFVKEIQNELFRIRREEKDKFIQKDLIQVQVKKMLQYGINVNRKDIEKFATPVDTVKSLYELMYLPAGAVEYSTDYGIKKYQLQAEEDMFD